MTKKLGITNLTVEQLKQHADEAKQQFSEGKKSVFVGLARASILIFYATKSHDGLEFLQELFATAGIKGKQKENGCVYKNCVVSCMAGYGGTSGSVMTKNAGALKAVAKYRSENPSVFANNSEQEQLDHIAKYIAWQTIEKLYLSMSESRDGLTYEEIVESGIEALNAINPPLAVTNVDTVSVATDFVVMIGRRESDGTTSVLEYLDEQKMVEQVLHKIGKRENNEQKKGGGKTNGTDNTTQQSLCAM